MTSRALRKKVKERVMEQHWDHMLPASEVARESFIDGRDPANLWYSLNVSMRAIAFSAESVLSAELTARLRSPSDD